MASSKDFIANQIRAAKLIMTGTQPGDGGIGVGNIGLAVYDQSKALNNEGGVNDAGLYANIGSEVAVLVSGSANYTGRDKDNTHVLFRGNMGTSGSMHFMNPATPVSSSVTLTFSNAPTATNRITFITADGTTKNFDAHASTTTGGSVPALFSRGGSKHGADNLKTSIEGSSISSKVSVSSVAGSDPYTLTVTQVTAGAAGNTSIASNLANVSVGGAAAAAAGKFSGGSGLDSGAQKVFVFADYDRVGHLYLSGNLIAAGDKDDPNPYGTISGSIHHTRDGLPYLVGIGDITITSASNGQVTISGSAGGGGGSGDVSLQYYDESNTTNPIQPFASGNYSVTIGTNNLASAGSEYTLVFGLNNTGSDAEMSVIGGGYDNRIYNLNNNSGYSRAITISGGRMNQVTGSSSYSTIGGGYLNYITGSTLADDDAAGSTIAGGDQNRISGSYNSIGGGSRNVIKSAGATIAGGGENFIDKIGAGSHGFIGGGFQNTGSSDYAAIPGGQMNSIGASSDFSFIGAGQKNKILGSSAVNSANYATIAGGQGNEILAGDGQQAPNSAILGGQFNKIQGSESAAIGGGQHNLVQNNHDKSLLFGQHLTSSAANQTILGYGSAFAGVGYVVSSGSFFKSDGLNGGAISGSITRTKENLPYLVAAGPITISTGSNGQITISGSLGGGGGGSTILQETTYSDEGGRSYFLSGTVTYAHTKLHGCLPFTVTADNAIGAGRFIGGGNQSLRDDGKLYSIMCRTVCPAGANNIQITIGTFYKDTAEGGGTDSVELVVCGRKLKDPLISGSPLSLASYDLSDSDADGKWLNAGDYSTSNPGFRGFTHATTRGSNKIDVVTDAYQIFTSRSIPISGASGIINDAGGSDSSAAAAGDVIDIAIARNKFDGGSGHYGTGTSPDNIANNDDFVILWTKITYTA